jgi:hypothetical protein
VVATTFLGGDEGEHIRHLAEFRRYVGEGFQGGPGKMHAPGGGFDTFLDYCQTEQGKEFVNLFLEQISTRDGPYQREIVMPEARKHFDTDAPSK